MKDNVKVVLVDDHVLLRSGLAGIVNNLGFEVLYECSNGRELTEQIDQNNLPDIVLLDINMPGMDGFETALWLREHYPLVNVIALSMYDDDISIIRMLKNGARGFILKDINPTDLRRAINEVIMQGYHYNEHINGILVKNIQNDDDEEDLKKKVYKLKQSEIEFLKYICTEMTYKEIAERMSLSPRTIDGYRDELFQKLGRKNRVGLVLFAIESGIIKFR